MRSKPASVRVTVETLEDRSVPAFFAPVTTAGGGVTLAIGDFNHDGRDDVASISGTFDPSSIYGVVAGNQVRVGLSNGDGTFKASATLSLKGGDYLGGFWARDVNADGHLDLQAVTVEKSYRYVYGKGDGGFEGGYYLWTLHETTWLGRGDGTFGRPSVQTTKNSRGTVVLGDGDIAYADFNRDGLLDWARVSDTSPYVSVVLKNPDDPYYTGTQYPGGENPDWVGVGDFNDDGWVDIIVINSQSSPSPTYSVLLNDGNR